MTDNNCACNLVGNFPFLGGLGIVSANLRVNREIVVNTDGLVLYGPTFGDLSITAYGDSNDIKTLKCPGKAGASYSWDRRYSCEDSFFKVYFIPHGRVRSYKEGDVNSNIKLTEASTTTSFSASASSGPTTIYLKLPHTDGYDFIYTGLPIPLSPEDAYNSKYVDFLDEILPENSKLYLQSFSWDYTPPNIPMISYSFIYSYDEA